MMKNFYFILLFIPLFSFSQKEDSLLQYIENCNFKSLNEQEYKVGDRIIAPEIEFVICWSPFFIPDSEKPKTSPESILKIVDFIKSHPDLTIEIGFHTDARGSDSINNVISKSRGETIDEEIKKHYGVFKNYTVKGYGENEPIIPLKDIMKIKKRERRKYYWINRRTELKIVGKFPPIPQHLFSCKEGIKRAVDSAKKGKYEIISFGLKIHFDWDFQNFYEKYILEKYGITITDGGCSVYEGLDCYSKEMKRIIYKKFGNNIFDKSKKDALTEFLRDTSYVFSSLKTMPVFKGGSDSLFSYFAKQLKSIKGIKGKIIATIIIETDGSISEVKIKNKTNRDIDDLISNIFYKMPKWNPGIYCGTKVRTRMSQPINFK